MTVGRLGGKRELLLGEETEVCLGLPDPASLRRGALARVACDEALLEGVVEDADRRPW